MYIIGNKFVVDFAASAFGDVVAIIDAYLSSSVPEPFDHIVQAFLGNLFPDLDGLGVT